MLVRRAVLLIALLIGALTPSAAEASPWTLPHGRVALRASTDVQTATSEFLPDGTRQRFPLRGEFFGANVRLELRYGLTPTVEIGTRVSAGHLNFNADEIFFGSPDATTYDAPTVREGIISFDRRATGVSDVNLFLRNRLTPIRRWVLAYEIDVKLPTGYEPPQGTFQDDVVGEQVNDDVALGDGQTDITWRWLWGAAPVNDLFLRLDAGFRLRTGDPGHQVLGAFKIGGRVSPAVVPFAFVDAEHTVTEGRVVGQSFTTPDVRTPATEFDGGDNSRIEPINLRLDRTAVRVGGGAILSVGDHNIEMGYNYLVYGQNVAQTHVFSLGTTLIRDTR